MSQEVNDDVETRRPDFWDKDYAKDLEEGAGVKPDTNAKDGPSAMEIYKVIQSCQAMGASCAAGFAHHPFPLPNEYFMP